VAEGEETRVCALDAAHKETRPLAINPQAHDWSAWTQTKAPTTTEEGEETRTCTLDATHKETRSIPKITEPSSVRGPEIINFGNGSYTNISSSKPLTDAQWTSVKTKLQKALDSASKDKTPFMPDGAMVDNAVRNLFGAFYKINVYLVNPQGYNYYNLVDNGDMYFNADYVLGATDADLLAKVVMAVKADFGVGPEQANAAPLTPLRIASLSAPNFPTKEYI
jgi:hypothetical protein